MVKLTDRQYKAFVRLLEVGDGDRDSIISEIIHCHGTWGDINNHEYSALDSVDRYSLVEAVVTGRFEKIRSPLEETERLIAVYEKRAGFVSKNDDISNIFNDFVTELEYLKEIILKQEGAE
ncbi:MULTISPECIES: hypothetical protein [Bacillus]|nr:hypothetical protein [Bacillus subtilis]MCY8984366.1 hypothetical protein [Bacillus subtilis]MDR4183388.1 hypothetical protein [Bacillus subtilis]